MLRIDARKQVHFCDGLTRRDFLHAGSLGILGLGLPAMNALEAQGAIKSDREMNCILLFLVGGPSQVDTWDPKPDSPAEIRGPFRPIATRAPGIQITEIFPRLAAMMDQVALVRSVYHTSAAVHDVGHQMMQTGRLFTGGIEHPHYGAVVARQRGSASRDAAARLAAAAHRPDGRQLAPWAVGRLPGQDVRSLPARRRPQ